LALALGHDEGCRALQEALPLADAFRPLNAARIRCLLAEAAVRRGDLAEAGRWLADALALPLAEQLLVTRAQTRLARAKGDHHRAWAFGDQGLSSAYSSGAQLLVVDFLELLAMLAADGDRFLDAARLLAATANERERLGYVRFLVEQRDIDLAKSRIEAALGPNGLAAALSEGASLSIDEAVGYARRRRSRRGNEFARLATRLRHCDVIGAPELSSARDPPLLGVVLASWCGLWLLGAR